MEGCRGHFVGRSFPQLGMDEKETFQTIDPVTFDALLEQYHMVIPEKLVKLDNERYTGIPECIKKQNGPPSLTKEHVVTLIDWKLYVI